MMALPDNIKSYLASQYEHYWGSIYLYAPEITSGHQTVHLKFSGTYRIESTPATVDGKKYAANAMVFLNKGDHASRAQKNYRLKLLPENPGRLLKPEFQDDNTDMMNY
jgi:hypothetical protein